jgi:outer membrane protein OmpA-like peptidoglycan-associated protein
MSAGSPVRGNRPGLLGLLAFVMLAACSSTPDWANPVAWYDNMFGEEATPSDGTPQTPPSSEARQRLEEAQKAPEPKVGSVPERPRPTSREERAAIAQGLAADREAARYTDEELRGRPASSNNLVSPPPPPSPEPAAPTPPAAPVAEAPPAAPAPSQPPAATPQAAAPAPQPVEPPPAPAPASPPAGPSVATAPVEPAPLTPAPQPTAPSPTVAAPAPVTAPPAVSAPTAPRLATMPPPPPGTPVAPVRGTSVLESAYLSALSQSAATVTTAPANPAFASPRPAPLQNPAVAVPPNVLETYHTSAPAAAYTAPTPDPMPAPPPRLAPSGVGGLPSPNTGVPFDRAGARLAGTVEFAAGSASLDRRDRDVVSSALAQHNTRGGTIRVVAYAPRSAGPVGAFRLAQDRANAVATELVRAGANQQYVFVEAHGYAADGNPNRVEIYLEN